ncbi:hypothetical protein A3H22_00910 [Candidatus Peribacteria bacterium RIFCSPLOWO2_12_FULL_55_15]|nr:MAG: hypothetical protein A2789_00670 [Candidatus Peribacteria bacterium RIFCSPHIGHO2_01_FULL_54_22]OGJ63573.1 MAG: hypothetical protein A3D12_03945 [Candidatus Peribacteria bacterium RIFCSPHIGHO2_02_FULL_55_24]OGJ65147.1 MAG: hypothetical protein A3E47_03320 [Candidatus Peribacteria bacterium RIFCSPHIGHO2_12_FULL_54_10]OGJ69560.1 MAG: hypothetical protein A3H90_02845 [Candidatus Peribacteria bacterium RIFCSPLOWO2_02_FULL_55_36]OGJ70210.1 MAG: hypothetical protein A3H22_00910 [Candidatus Per
MQREELVRRFVEKIWQWYAKNKRTLPWRDLQIADDTQRAYMILVSEVMLQQTQVSRVQLLFPRFLPNRIFRGKVIDLLRDHPRGLTLAGIGRES